MPIPPPPPQPYFDGIQLASNGIGVIAASFVDTYNRFWRDPIGEAAALNAETRAAGMTAAEVFLCHGATVNFMAVVRPSELARLTPFDPIAGPPIPVTFFDENGDIDIPALESAWTAYQESLTA